VASISDAGVRPVPPPSVASALHVERVTRVHHWTRSLFSFGATRSPTLRFASGGPMADRVMLCGAHTVLAEFKQMLPDRGFEEGAVSRPGDFVLERAFVET